MNNLEQFVADIEQNYPTVAKSLMATVEEGGERLEILAEDILKHYTRMAGGDITVLTKSFATMVLHFIKLQYKYEMTGKYVVQYYDDVRETVYDDSDGMTNYMLGLVCTQFAWPHHFKLWCFFEDHFLTKLSDVKRVLELAPGHGYFGLSLLRRFPEAHLTGVDISPASIVMSQSIAAEFGEHVVDYRLQDAMCLTDDYQNGYDVVICGELLEHVPNPERILANVYKALRPGGLAYVTAAITAAANDHIYEFENAEQVITMTTCEGLILVDQVCEGTRPLTASAKGEPRTLSMILTKD